MLNKLKKIIIFLISYFIIDFALSYLFLFNLIFLDLEKIYQSDIQNRIFNKDYKYTFKPNVSFMSKYNDYIYKIETNNFGYRDEKIRKIKHSENLYLFAGDSFLEGVGLNFEDTLLGHLNNKIKKKKILLNSGMASYSPFIYKKKIISFIENNQNHKPERVVIIFDKSDPMDDQQYLNHTGKFKENTYDSKYKKNLSEKFIFFAFVKILANYLDEKGRDFKYRYKLSKDFNSSFFSFTQNQVTAFKSIGNRRFVSNYYTDSQKWNNETKNFIMNSFHHIKNLDLYLSSKKIKLDIIIYPWSFELVNKNVMNDYLKFINELSTSNNLTVHSCYDYFINKEILDQLEFIGKTYLFADVHYNSTGYEILAECIKNKLKL